MLRQIKFIFKFVKFLIATIYIFFVLSTLGSLWSLITLQPKRAQEYWSRLGANFLGVTLKFTPDSKPQQTNKRTMILLNHLTQGDFFIHELVLKSSASFLARYMVAVIFPLLYFFSQTFTQAVWFFKRGSNDLEKLFTWIDYKFDRCSRPNLLVYPEGHRMSDRGQPGPLKKGMLKYAYTRKLDVQLGIVFGIEQAFNEKKFHFSRGPNVVTCCLDNIITPNDYSTFEEFFQVIEKKFQDKYREIYQVHYKVK